MKRNILLAPWRMKYLEGPGIQDCFLCEALKAEEMKDHLVLVKTARTGIVMNRYPYNNGHVMVVPREHASSLTELDPDTLMEMMIWVRNAESILGSVYQADGFNIGVNIGAAAGAGLADHLHIHVMPRWSGDTNFMTTCGDVRVVPEELAVTYAKLAPLFDRCKGSVQI